MKQRIVFILTAIAFILGQGAGASEPPADVKSLVELEDYLAYAAMHNAGLQVAFEQWKIAVEQVPQAKSLPNTPRPTSNEESSTDGNGN